MCPSGAVFAAEQFTETLELNEVNVEMVLDEVSCLALLKPRFSQSN